VVSAADDVAGIDSANSPGIEAKGVGEGGIIPPVISFVRNDRECSPVWTALRGSEPGPVFARSVLLTDDAIPSTLRIGEARKDHTPCPQECPHECAKR
jgi:hypothetical protein